MRDHLDRYYTPDDVARALVPLVPLSSGETVWEPHAGGGAFARAMLDHTSRSTIYISDIDPDAPGLDLADRKRVLHAGGCGVRDALDGPPLGLYPDWIVGNPPFKGIEGHIEMALDHAHVGAAFLARLAILESSKRINLWRRNPATDVYVLAQRPSFTGGGTDSAAYGFFIWRRGYTGPTRLHILDWKGSR